MLSALAASARADTDCADGNGVLDNTPPKGIAIEELIRKFSAAETRAQEARSHFTFTQDVLVQTLSGKSVDGQLHEISQVSFDDKGRRLENVTYAEQPTLRNLRLTESDMEDIHFFMPWFLPTTDVPLYTISYAGQQHVDDLDTYVFHVAPRREEKNQRYFQGRIWIDAHDFQIVKLCGKSVPDEVHVKKNQRMDIRPMFVAYRQFVDGNWLPAYARVDDTLNFQRESIHMREIVKFTGYKRAEATNASSRP